MNRFVRCCAAVLAAWWVCDGAGAETAKGAEPDLTQWQHVAQVELTERAEKGLVEAALPPEVLALALPDLADLRVATQSLEAVPYVLRTDRGGTERSQSYRPQRIFNATYVSNAQSRVTVDFGGRATRTRVDIDTPGTNFRRRVSVEASADGETWQMLRQTAWLFRIAHEGGGYNKNEVTLPDNDFRYLRITVFNAPDDPEQVPIRDVLAWEGKSTPPATVEITPRSITRDEDGSQKATEIAIDLGYENLPLHSMELSFEDANFLRRVEVMGRPAAVRTVMEPVENAPPRKREIEEPWRSLSGGTLYRFPGGEGQEPSNGLSLSLTGQDRYVLLRIFNGDDAPLKFRGIKVFRLQMYLSFQPSPSGPYRLYLGNPQAARPQYDLVNFAERLRGQSLATATIGPVGPNPLFAATSRAAPWSERYAWALWVALICVLGVLGILVVFQARRVKPTG